MSLHLSVRKILAVLALGIAILATQMSGRAAPGTIAAYGFSEGTGTTTVDRSGNGITGTLHSASWGTGSNGGGLIFNGTSAYVDLGNSAPLQLTGSLTVSAWVNENANVGDDGIIISKSNGVSGWELKSSPDTGSRTFAIAVYGAGNTYNARYSTTVRALNTWYHVAGVYNAAAGTLDIYVNGVLDNGSLSGSVPSAISNPSVNVNIGRREAGFHISGILDDVRLYGRALSAAEIVADMNTSVDGTSDTIAPSVPTDLTATAVSSSQINLSWTKSTDDTGVAGYKIFRDGSLINTSPTNSYSDTGLISSTTYTYMVSAYDGATNESAPSSPVSATTSGPAGDTTPPTVSMTAPVNGATVAGTSTTVTATASDNVGVSGVQFLLDGASLSTEDTTSPYSFTWNTTTASDGAHTLSARARDAVGNSTTATTVNVIVDNQAPTGSVIINGGAAATNTTSVTLTLAASDALSAVTQMRFSNTGSSYSTAEAYAPTKAWTLSNSAGTKTVYVQFKDAPGNWSTAATDTIVLDTTAPTISAVSSSNITDVAATVGWTTSEAATSQVEYGATVAYGQTTAIDNTLVSAHSVVIAGLQPSTLYNYRVRSKDAAGNERIGTNATFTTKTTTDTVPPTVPTGLSATGVSVSQIDLSWIGSTDNVGVTGYRVFRNGAQVATVTSGNSYSDTSLTAGTSYSYTVSAQDAANNSSAQSAPASGSTLPDTVSPSGPTGLTATTISSSVIALSWPASTDNVAVVGYDVFRDDVKVGTVTTPGYGDSGLSASTSYAYYVIAFDLAGNRSVPSPVAKATTQALDTTAPTVPTGVTAQAVTTSQVDLSWQSSTDDVAVAGYKVFRNGTQVATVTTGTTYSDPGLSANTTYTYSVSAYDLAGNQSAASSPASVTTPQSTPSMVPMPLISRFPGVNAFASNDLTGTATDFGANRGRDNVYDGWGHYWDPLGLGYPAWLAYDLSGVPVNQRKQVLVAWYNETDGYNSASNLTTPLSYNEPGDYVIEANPAAGSTAGAPSTGWVALVTVTGNTVHSRSHIVDLTGYNWIRFRSTRGAAANQPGNTDVEIKLEIYDAHLGNTNSWAFLGDSITNGGMNHLEHGDMNFAQRVNASVPSHFPMYENAGQPFDRGIDEGMTRLNTLLANTKATYIGISYGTNDAGGTAPNDYSFYNAYKAMVDVVLASGRIPVIPTIPWTAQQPWQNNEGDPITGSQFTLNRQLAKLKADYRALGKTIVDGPDLWTFFKNNPSLIGNGDIHPTAAGYVAMRNQWAQAAIANTIHIDTAPPSVPTQLAAVPLSVSQIALSWAASTDDTGVVGYRVFRNGQQIASGPATSFTDTNLLPQTTYSYAVLAVDAAANASALSAAVNGTTLADTTPPTVPGNPTATAVSMSQINLAWSSSLDNVGVTGYGVYRDGNQIATTPTTNYFDTGLLTSTTYSYAVAAYDGAGNLSAQSSSVQATTLSGADTAPPTVPTGLEASNVTANTVVLSWTASSDNIAVTGYRVFRDGSQVGTTAQTTYQDSGLSPSTLYSYRVAAYDAVPNVSAQSAVLDVTTGSALSGLIAGYGFNEGSGTTTSDASGNRLTGTLSGATWTTAGKSGAGLVFNGTNSFVDLGTPTALQITGSLTLTAWVKESANVGDDGTIISKSNGAAGWELKSSPDLGNRNFAIGVYTSGGGYVGRYSTTVRALNTWYHVAAVYDAAARTLNIYVNGVLDNGSLVGTVPASLVNPSVNANIGRRAAGFNIQGTLDDVRVYNRALAASEILTVMNAPY